MPPPAFQRDLLKWYARARRDLPWRKDISPYRTWVSEIMLQQTTVKTVLSYYDDFLREFPDIPSLASAREERVLKAWAGLGYYSRARLMRIAAKKIMAEHKGAFPSAYEDVLALPGIGRYTAGAILSIAFEKPYPVLDGNVARVFARLRAIEDDVKDAKTVQRLWRLAERLVPLKHTGDWNQALMELGAVVCLPEKPNCGSCPVSRHCQALQRGLQDELPVASKRKAFIALKWNCLWIEQEGKVLLWKRNPEERFLKNHWGLPEARHIRAPAGAWIKTVRHAITHHRITLEVVRGKAPEILPPEAAWVPKAKLKDHLVSSLWLKCL
ncbi:MAG: A/G-specific adenine glycosylase [Elusimicrobia bacterium]|nr:A/G-specific adenine glycosylase [Elusimicrobiota bacterium]